MNQQRRTVKRGGLQPASPAAPRQLLQSASQQPPAQPARQRVHPLQASYSPAVPKDRRRYQEEGQEARSEPGSQGGYSPCDAPVEKDPQEAQRGEQVTPPASPPRPPPAANAMLAATHNITHCASSSPPSRAGAPAEGGARRARARRGLSHRQQLFDPASWWAGVQASRLCLLLQLYRSVVHHGQPHNRGCQQGRGGRARRPPLSLRFCSSASKPGAHPCAPHVEGPEAVGAGVDCEHERRAGVPRGEAPVAVFELALAHSRVAGRVGAGVGPIADDCVAALAARVAAREEVGAQPPHRHLGARGQG